MDKIRTHLLVVHVDAKDVETAIKALKARAKLAALPSLGYELVHIETLEGYCGTCEDRRHVQYCPRAGN